MSKARKSLLIVAALVATVAIIFISQKPPVASAQKKGVAGRAHGRKAVENYDIRKDKAAAGKIEGFRSRAGRAQEHVSALQDRQSYGVDRLRERISHGVKVEYSDDLHVPEVIGPDVRDGKGALTAPSTTRRRDVLKNFLKSNSDVVGVEQSEVDALKTAAEYTDPDGKLSFVELRQEIGGIPVFKGQVKAGFAKTGEVVRVVNDLAPGLAGASISTDFGDPVVAADLAAANIGAEPGSTAFTRNDAVSTDQKAVLGSGDSAPTAEKLYFPTEPGVVVPAWRVTLWDSGTAYNVIVDARTGTVLWRKCMTNDQSTSVTYNVYANPNAMINVAHSPFPFSPGPVSPNGAQGAVINRTLVTRIGNEAPYTFNNLGWVTDGVHKTDGNNVQAGLDIDGTDGIDPGTEAPGTVTGTNQMSFSFVYSPTNPNTGTGDPTTDPVFRNGITTQLFYICNWYHDETYRLGFTEQAGNFQNDNFGRGGVGGDRVSAEAQDSSGFNNANFSTFPDGTRGKMQMYIFNGNTPGIDGSLDADVVIHEHTHGLSNRLHGNADGLVDDMSSGMGEGWSDFYALSMLSQPSDPIQGIYTTGAYATYHLGKTFVNNSYYGIRRFPYAVKSFVGSNGKPHNPLTFADIDGTKMNLTDGAFPAAFTGTADEAHNSGEVWCSMLWEVRANFVTRLGWAVGNRRALQLVTDGMKLAPLNPTFIQERDAIVAAAIAGGVEADVADVWAGFATRGLGAGASIQNSGGSSTGGTNTTRVTEAFDLPNITQTQDLTVSDSIGDNDGFAEPGETVNIAVPITNNTGRTATGVTVSVNGGPAVSYGTLTGTQSGTQNVAYTIPANATCGAFTTVTVSVTSSLGTVNFQRQIFVGKPETTAASQNFDSVSSPALPSGWTVTSEQGGTNWVTSATTPDTAPNVAYAVDPSSIGGGTSLVSPMVSVTSSTASLTFRHMFNTEVASGTTWDGGVLEISIAGGSFQDITAAGGAFTQNGYNTTLGISLNNPLIGRAAWGGNSGGYITTTAQLPPAANGKLVQLRWRFGADNNGVGTGTNPGWYVDTISVSGAGFVTSYACQYTPAAGSASVVSGRVLNQGGFGLGRARVSITAGGVTQTVMSNSFGYYTFQNITSGQSVTLNARVKGYTFAPLNVQVTGNLAGVNLQAQ